MIRLVVIVLCLAACREHTAPPPRMPAAFQLELAALYERYQRLDLAEHELDLARGGTTDPALLLALESALGRVEEARGDRTEALAALGRAHELYELVTANPRVEAAASALVYVDPHELALRRARLYAETDQFEHADQMWDALLDNVTEPFERDRILLERITAYRAAGTLGARVATWEKREPADARTLRLLAVAYGDGIAGNVGTGDPAKRVHVLEQLARLAPNDASVRDALLAGYERMHDAAGALAVVERAPPAAPVTDACPQGTPPTATPPAVETIERAVQSLARMDDRGAAIAEVRKLDALATASPPLRVAAYAMAARLYWPLGNVELAEQSLAAAMKAARTVDERRLVEQARAFGFERAQRTGALSQLYDTWAHGDDPCLRAEGVRGLARFQQLASKKP